MPFIEREFPVEHTVSSKNIGKDLRILIIVDPRCVNEPMHPLKFDSWGTVYCYFIVKGLQENGVYVEFEDIEEARQGSFSRLKEDSYFDHALFIVNRVSDRFGESLFDNVRSRIRKNGKIYTIDDQDDGIRFEDVRFCAIKKEPEIMPERKKQIFWGVDNTIFNNHKDEETLRVLLDTWHFQERKWDRTKEILKSALVELKNINLESIGKKRVEIIAWGPEGPEIFSEKGDLDRLKRIPPRVSFFEMVELLSISDIFMVTHSESMGLTILEAAVSGCLVAIPVPAKNEEKLGHFIKQDLTSTIPHFSYPMTDSELNPPWNEIIQLLDPHKIRESCIDLNWNAVSIRMIEEFKQIKKSTLVSSFDKNGINSFDERSRMLSMRDTIGKEGTSVEVILNCIINWYNHPNFDTSMKEAYFQMLRSCVGEEEDLQTWFKNKILNLYSDSSGLPLETISSLGKMGVNPEVSDFRLNWIGKILNDLNWGLDDGHDQGIDGRDIMLENMKIFSERGFIYNILHSIHAEKIDQTWSLSRIIGDFYGNDPEILESMAKHNPLELDIWKILIRHHWNENNQKYGISLAKRALEYHPYDSWLIEISNRGG